MTSACDRAFITGTGQPVSSKVVAFKERVQSAHKARVYLREQESAGRYWVRITAKLLGKPNGMYFFICLTVCDEFPEICHDLLLLTVNDHINVSFDTIQSVQL